MYEKHSAFKTPSRSGTIWRFLSFANFVWLIAEESLYFSRLDQHEDQWEGMLPTGLNVSLQKYIRFNRYINCWHMNSIESDAMWKLYGNSSGETIAIRTTVGGLIQSLTRTQIPVHIGKVRYEENIESEISSLYSPVIYKRKSFQHEKELRLCISSERNPNPPDLTLLKDAFSSLRIPYTSDTEILKGIGDRGLCVRVDLHHLVGEVFICPNSKAFLKDSVRYIMKDKLPGVKIIGSSI